MAKNINDQFNNPFSNLKGLSALRQQEKVEKKQPVPSVPEPAKPTLSANDNADIDFSDAMSGLGVQAIDRTGLEKTMRPVKNEFAEATVSSKDIETDSPEVAGGGVAQARRKKQLKRGQVTPEAELDLHGVRAEELQDKINWFFENAQFHGFEVVRIITGKGSHSETGPVLRPLVESYLDGAGRSLVVEWMRAPQRQGGEGAIIAFLRVRDL